MNEISPIPVTILTGFLGSGKTTLLNYLLNHSNNERIAIIENEFASEGIDGALIQKSASVEVIELANGCVCCTIKGAFLESLLALNEQSLKAHQAGERGFDRLIIETTGLADPSPIIQTFFTQPELQETFMLDAVIALVDAKHTSQHLKEHPVCASQIGFADKIIITKENLVDQVTIDTLIEDLLIINRKAPIVFAKQGLLAQSEWLDLHAFHLNTQSPIAAHPMSFSIKADTELDTKQNNSQLLQQHSNVSNQSFTQPTTQSYDQTIKSHVLKTGHLLDLDKIGQWMENIIEQYGHDLLRYKGILRIHNEPRCLIVQGIHKVVGFDYGDVPPEENTNTVQQSIIVLIGRNLPIDEIKQSFKESYYQ